MKALRAVAVIAVLIIFFPLTVRAENELSDIYGSLPSQVTENLPDGFEEDIAQGDGSNAVKRIDGAFIISAVGGILNSALSDSASLLLPLAGIVFLSAILKVISDSGVLSTALGYTSALSAAAASLTVIIPLWNESTDALKAMGGIIKTSLPVMTGICAMSGQVSSGMVNAAWLTAALTLIEELTRSVLSPLLSVCLCFLSVSALIKPSDISLTGMVAAVKKIFVFFISLLAAALCIVMSLQTVIAKSADGVLLKSVRFAFSSSVPIVGSAVSEAASTYLTGISVIKSSAGTLIAAAVVLSVLPLILKLFAVKAVFGLLSLSSEILGVNTGVIKEFSSIIDLMLAILAIVSTVFVICAGVFASVLPSA